MVARLVTVKLLALRATELGTWLRAENEGKGKTA
jgi:hypothetical protein